ncbi:MAG TPA: molybdopterin adenylyltransferase [Kiritimatiellia bacterium]|nr:molybdopterin adenylyltransferase [Kiritimatiellia bacterium]HMO99126.1 molybdopterin adenylyltransferase [Kiritimatiellia bacterium]HMP95696.1 molybdopterin adenylyltransferase [Kiritimatiellia bacterium]
MNETSMIIGIINVSDRASAGVYEDIPGKEAKAWLEDMVATPWQLEYAVVPDEQDRIAATLIDMADRRGCRLIITTGGTGPAPRDVTPEATMQVCERLLPGFGEAMRADSRRNVPTAILSRQIAGSRGACLIVNLPGKPAAIRECLNSIATALPYAIFLISGSTVEYRPGKTEAFRPRET